MNAQTTPEATPEIPWYDQISPRQRDMCPRCQSIQPVYAQLTPRDNYQGKWMLLRCYICNAPVREFWALSGNPPQEETPRAASEQQLGLFTQEETA